MDRGLRNVKSRQRTQSWMMAFRTWGPDGQGQTSRPAVCPPRLLSSCQLPSPSSPQSWRAVPCPPPWDADAPQSWMPLSCSFSCVDIGLDWTSNKILHLACCLQSVLTLHRLTFSSTWEFSSVYCVELAPETGVCGHPYMED